jgi:predicted SnoaL-like aldol condensation-catalyzing enzyme
MSSAPHALTTLEQNKQLAVRWFEEVWNQGRRETIAELFAENGVIHDGAEEIRGPEEFNRFYDALRARFKNIQIKPGVSVAEGDRVSLQWSCDMMDGQTGKPLHITGLSIVRIENGQFAEAWQNWDKAHLVSQLTGQPAPSFT